MSELQKPAALQFRHSNSDGFVAAYEKEEMDKYLSEVVELISTIRAERDEYRYNLSCARNEIHNLSTSMREDVTRKPATACRLQTLSRTSRWLK